MSNFQPNPPFGGGYYPPQYPPPNQIHGPPPYNMMPQQQQFMPPQHLQMQHQQQQHRLPVYPQIPLPGSHVFQGNANAFANNGQYPPQGLQTHNNAGPPPPPPQYFYPPSFSSNLPPPPFPPPVHGYNSQNIPPSVNNAHSQSQISSHANTPQHTPAHTAPPHYPFNQSGKEALAGMGLGSSKPATPNGTQPQTSHGTRTTWSQNESPLTRTQIALRGGEFNASQGPNVGGPSMQAVEKSQASQLQMIPQSQAQAILFPVNPKSLTPNVNKESAANPSQKVSTHQPPPVTKADSVHMNPGASKHSSRAMEPAAGELAAGELAAASGPAAESTVEEVTQKRENAKAALKQLKQYNIGIEQLVKEGIDVNILKMLYAELGFPTDSPPLITEPEFQKEPEKADVEDYEPAPANAISLGIPGLSGSENADAPISSSKSDISLEPGEVTEGDSADLRTDQIRTESKVFTATVDTSKDKVSQSSVKMVIPVVPALKKPVDRQSYLAKLQAAKMITTKLSASTPTSTLSELPVPKNTTLTVEAPAQVEPMKEKSADKILTKRKSEDSTEAVNTIAEAQKTIHAVKNVEPTAESRKSEAEVKRSDAKDLAQTELIRQRLEALKNNTKTNLQAGKTNGPPKIVSEVSSTLPRNTFHELPPKPVTTTEQIPNQTLRADAQARAQYTPVNSFFASGERKSFGILPGLSPVSSSHQIYSKAPLKSENEELSDQASSLPSKPAPSSSAAFPEATEISANQSEAAIDQYLDDLNNQSMYESDSNRLFSPASGNASFGNAKGPSSRKRATAMDFIDSPPRYAKRRMGSNEPMKLVIEVSDDEEERDDIYEEDETAINHATSQNERNTSPKALRNLPPLSNLPPKVTGASSLSTPSGGQTPKALAKHEAEIKALHQKIVEMEHKRIAKKAANGNSTPLSWTNQPSMSRILEDKADALEAVNQQLVEQKSSLAAAKSLLQQKLETEKRTQALIVARADTEQKGAARATTSAEKQKRLDRKAALEAAVPKLDLDINAARSRLENIRRQQDEVQREIEESIQGRKAFVEELRGLLESEMDTDEADASDVTIPPPPVSFPIKPEQSTMQVEETATPIKSPVTPVEESAAAFEESAVSLNEPAASVEEPANSVKELAAPAEDIAVPVEESVAMVEDTAESPSLTPEELNDTFLEDIMDISSPGVDEGQIISSKASVSDVPWAEEQSAEVSEVNGEGQPLERQLSVDADEDNMDSENIELDYPPSADDQQIHHDFSVGADESSGLESNESAMSDTEEYAPALEVRSPSQPQNVPISIHSSSEESTCSSVSHSAPSQQLQGNPMEADNRNPDTLLISSDDQQEEGEVSPEASADDDDYEPPEPSFSVDNVPADTEMHFASSLETAADANDVDDAYTPEAVEPAPVDAPVSSVDNPVDESFLAVFDGNNHQASGLASSEGSAQHANKSNDDGGVLTVDQSLGGTAQSAYGHYTPYESPLSQFTSYRFHPQYVSKVPGGFRSLTYSHKINPSEPLCQWELAGGLCNDSSCSHQHFHDLSLPDSDVLIQLLGVREGRTTEDKDRYAVGLKHVIAGLRDKNINDIGSIAREIVAYRAKFLGDNSRILTNLS